METFSHKIDQHKSKTMSQFQKKQISSAKCTLRFLLSIFPVNCFVSQHPLKYQSPSRYDQVAKQAQDYGTKSVSNILTFNLSSRDSTLFSSISSDTEDDMFMLGHETTTTTSPSIHSIVNEFWEDSASKMKNYFQPSSLKSSNVLDAPIPSEQVQLSWIEKLTKAISEECVPWLLTFLLPTTAALVLQSEVPLLYSMVPEMLFLAACSMKVLTKFDKPSYPEPLLQNRDWNYVIDSMWSSQPDIDSRKKFLMGWFYNSAPFERLRREDAIRFLAWMRFGMMEEQLTSSQMNEVRQVYLRKLEKEVNGGKPLPLRGIGEKPLPCLRFNLEPLRYRHKPLIFYGIIRSARELFSAKISEFGFRYRSPKNPKKELGYWYRPPCAKNRDIITPTPLVFVHGVGGASFYFQLIERLSNEIEKDSGAAMILFDLPFVSLGISDDIPLISDQVDSICKTLDETVGSDVKSTFVGHSFGSIVLSWMVQSRPERVANCVFLDPICFQLHLSDTLFNFHMTRVDRDFNAGRNLENPFSVGGLRSLAGTELHTNHAMLRRFSWATNALWPQCLEKNGISASILLSEKDEIVPSSEIETLVIDYQRNKRKKCPRENNMSFENFLPMNDTASGGKRTFIRVQKMPGAGHGAFAFEKNHREKVVHTVLAMRRLNDIHRKKPSRTGNSFPFPFETLTIPTVPLWSGKIETNHTLHV